MGRQTIPQVIWQYLPTLAAPPEAMDCTWDAFHRALGHLLTREAPDKRQLPAFSPVILQPGATELLNDTVAATTMLVYDLDQLTPESLAALCQRVGALGAAAFMYESPSSTPEAPKVRLILPLDQPIDVARHKPARAFIAEALELQVDPKTNDPRRIYFAGSLHGTPTRQTILWDGAMIPSSALPGPPVGALETPTEPGPAAGGDEYHATPEHIHAMAEALRPAWDAGNRQAWVLELLGWLRGKGWPESDLTGLVEDLGDSDGGTNPLSDFLGMVKRAKPLTGLSAFVQQALGPAMAQADALAEAHPNTTSSRITNAGGQPQAPIDPGLYAYLLVDGKGKPKQNPENTRRVLEWHPAWVSNLRFNTLAQAVEIVDAERLPDIFRGNTRDRVWTAQHTMALRCWFHATLDLDPGLTLPLVVGVVARLKSYSPVADYLGTLTWDGVPRLDNWMISYLGASTDNPEYLRAVGPRILISAVARAHTPGCQADSMLILEGEQGTGKSSAVRILAGQWFDDTELDLTNLKDSGMQLRNVWLYEWGELAGLRRNEIARVKSWVSKRDDRFRAPYAPEVESQPRHCVFIGTCNPAGDYLADTTGNRRFWPVLCGAIDLKGLARDRDQLWAEAQARYQAGAEWHLTDGLVRLARTAQEARETEDPLENRAVEWVGANPGHTAAEILSGLGFTYSEQTHALATRLGAVLARRCLRDRVSRGIQRVRNYRLRDM